MDRDLYDWVFASVTGFAAGFALAVFLFTV
jgi:hypothetical protein